MVFVWLMLALVFGLAYTYFALANSEVVQLVLPTAMFVGQDYYVSATAWELVAIVFIAGVVIASLFGVFAGVMRGAKAGRLQVELKEAQDKVARLTQRIEQLEAELEQAKEGPSDLEVTLAPASTEEAEAKPETSD